jgi:hypothetical protein
MQTQDWSELETNLTGFGGLLFNLFGLLIDIVFGLVGGLTGGAIFRPRRVTA